MNKRGFILIVLILALIVFVWQVFWPAYGRVALLRQERDVWQEKLNDTNSLSQKLRELEKKYDNLGSGVERMAMAVPQNEDIAILLVQLEALTSQNGLIMNSVAFFAPTKKQAGGAANSVAKNESAAAAGAKITIIDLSLSGTQSALKNFLNAVENNLRIMDLSVLSFDAQSSFAASGLTDFHILINAYYQE